MISISNYVSETENMEVKQKYDLLDVKNEHATKSFTILTRKLGNLRE